MSSLSAPLSLVLTIASHASADAETLSPAESIPALNLTHLASARTRRRFSRSAPAERPFFPGMAPLETPAVPIVYQLVKSVRHSTTALSEEVAPCLNSPDDHRRLLLDSFATT